MDGQKQETVVMQPFDVVPLLRNISGKRQEHFGIILLDFGQRVIKKKVLFIGTEGHCEIDLKIIYWQACLGKASAVILFHNHPTGILQPSERDIRTTGELEDGFCRLGIQMLDHIIVGRTWQGNYFSYFSFKEHDLLTQKENVSVKRVAD